MTDSLREGELANGFDPKPFAKTIPAPDYDPDREAYKVDESANPYLRLSESIAAGSTIDLSLACADGRREYLKLDAAESKAWVHDPLPDRIEFANAKIRERRATTAYTAARRLQESGDAPGSRTLSADEEACLREFGLLEDAHVPLAEGGYDKQMRICEGAVASAKLREDGFWDGGFGDGAYGYAYTAPTQREYLPRGGPQGQQQHLSDVWDNLAKAYFAWTHDPVIRAACELITDFILGRGVSIVANDKNVQPIIDEYVEREQVSERLHTASVSLCRDGELFTRRFKLGDGRMKHRVLPAETIWEVITDAEDVLSVYWYVQRYPTRWQLFVPAGLDAAKQRWVERTIPADEMIHTKINAKESDIRGKGDVYPALGWAKRLRDYFDAIIQKEYAAAAYQWDYTIKGGQTAIDQIVGSIIPSERPVPGSYFAHNDLVDVKAVAAQIRAVSGSGTAYESLLNHIALAFVLSKSYFGADSHQNRASALVATEPTAKHLETRQNVISNYLSVMIQDVLDEAKAYGKLPQDADLGFRCIFPQIIKADSQTRVTMLRQAEASFYASRRTVAEQVAGEAEIENYDFDEEMAKIKSEIDADPLKLTAKDQEPVKRGLPDPTDVAFAPGDVPNMNYTPSSNGHSNVGSNGHSNVGSNGHSNVGSNGHSNVGSNGQAHQSDGQTPQLPKPDAGAASPTSATGAAKIRDEQGRGGPEDRSTIEQQARQISDEVFKEAARRRGVIVITP